jgi:anti-sigma regulatory factor (Ser/Thr protein kinase)
MVAPSQAATRASPIGCDVRLPAAPASVRDARDLAEEAAAAFGLGDEDTFQFKLGTSEAVANAIEHGAPCSDGRIRMRVRERPAGTLRVCVFDCGKFDPPAEDSDPLSDRGRGLGFIALLMDDVEVRGGPRSTVVCMTKRRSRGF